jgi:hypothetical protein
VAGLAESGARHIARRPSYAPARAVYGVGWASVCAATLAILFAGTAAAVLGMVLLLGTLVLALVLTASGPRYLEQSSGPVGAWTAWSTWGPAERTRLLRIINLSRVTSRPAGANLLLSELDDALAAEPLASWPPLSTRGHAGRMLTTHSVRCGALPAMKPGCVC